MLTDADRLQIVAMALMQHSVFTVSGGGTGGATYNVIAINAIENLDIVTITSTQAIADYILT